MTNNICPFNNRAAQCGDYCPLHHEGGCLVATALKQYVDENVTLEEEDDTII